MPARYGNLPWPGQRYSPIKLNIVTKKRYTVGHFILDLLLTAITGGIWLVWLLFKALHRG